MRLCGLRLLVALLTFGAGVAISSLWNYLRAPLFCPMYIPARPLAVSTSETFIIEDEVPDPTLSSEALTPLERCKLGLPVTPLVSFGSLNEMSGRVYPNAVLQGKSISKPVPRYPADAKVARVEGSVHVQIVVGEDGNTLTAKAISGHELLRDAAVDAACRSRFAPTRLSGQPIKVIGVITYNFVLN